MAIVLNGSLNHIMEEERRLPPPPPVKGIMDVAGTAARVRYLMEVVLNWSAKTWSIRSSVHQRTIENYKKLPPEGVDPIGQQVRNLVKSANSTIAFLAGETDDPGPNPFGKLSLSSEEKEYLEICRKEFEAAVTLRENSQLEYDAARKYRLEYERMHNLKMDLAPEPEKTET